MSNSSGGEGKPPKDSSKVVTWLRNKLQVLARLLGKLAGKLAAALLDVVMVGNKFLLPMGNNWNSFCQV